MVTQINPQHRRRGMLTTDMIVAMGLLLVGLIPLSHSFFGEQKLCRVYYFRALASQIVDGEMEVLAAGEWRHALEGTHPYEVRSAAATNLPPGRFTLQRQGAQLRLEWAPERKNSGARVLREAVGK